jgi:hypothetical protein
VVCFAVFPDCLAVIAVFPDCLAVIDLGRERVPRHVQHIGPLSRLGCG